MVKQIRVDGIGLVQLAPIVFVRTARRETVAALLIQLGKLLQGVVAVLVLVTGDLLRNL